MIAAKHPPHHDAETDGLRRMLEALAQGLQQRDLESVLRCFHQHAMLLAPDEAVPKEGHGALRSYFRSRLSARRLASAPRLVEVGFGGPDRAHGRAVVPETGDELLFAAAHQRGRWEITHCRWTTGVGLTASA